MKRFLVVSALVTLAACGGDSATTPSDSGTVTIQDTVVGAGAAVVVGNTVTVNYIGMFTNGTVFESSYTRGVPYQFPTGAGRVIPGFEQAIVGTAGFGPMKVGGKRRATIPPSLAYGSTGQGSIPPNTTLVFDLELMSIP